MSADQDMMDIIDHTAKFQCSRLRGDGVKAYRVVVWNEIAGIAYNEHVTSVCLKQFTHQQTTVHTREHDCFGLHSTSANTSIDILDIQYTYALQVLHDKRCNHRRYVLI